MIPDFIKMAAYSLKVIETERRTIVGKQRQIQSQPGERPKHSTKQEQKKDNYSGYYKTGHGCIMSILPFHFVVDLQSPQNGGLVYVPKTACKDWISSYKHSTTKVQKGDILNLTYINGGYVRYKWRAIKAWRGEAATNHLQELTSCCSSSEKHCTCA